MKALAAAAAAALFVVPASLARSGATPTALVAKVGPGFTITLTKAGKKVTTLKAGVYSIKVQDKSNIHNFHLTGSGLNKTTSVGKVITVTWKVTLKKGAYKYICDPHAAIMKGSFTVK